jgi:hypothetical protein
MRKVGDVMVLYNPGSRVEHESWTRGTIRETIARHRSGSHALHVVRQDAFKWDRDAPWGLYDGVPEVLVRETEGEPELEFVDTWPRRGTL